MKDKNTLQIIHIENVEEITPEEEAAARAVAANAPAIAYMRCISNKGGFDGEDWIGLTVGKTYKMIGFSKRLGWLRVVDDSGEDYLYPPQCFEPVTNETRCAPGQKCNQHE